MLKNAGSFAGLGFLAWYLAGKIRVFNRRGHVAKLCIVLLPLLCSSLIAISRVDDYWHHWQDVFAGGILGLYCIYMSLFYHQMIFLLISLQFFAINLFWMFLRIGGCFSLLLTVLPSTLPYKWYVLKFSFMHELLRMHTMRHIFYGLKFISSHLEEWWSCRHQYYNSNISLENRLLTLVDIRI